MGSENISQLATELLIARESLQGVEIPPSGRPNPIDMEGAYAVEAEIMRQRQAAGHTPNGRKVGYANKAMWRILKLDTLVWARMYTDSVHFAQNNAGELPAAGISAGRLEPEIVFKLKETPALGLDAAGALACCEWVALGLEIIDCPFPGWEFQPVDFVAAYGLHRAELIGDPRPIAEIPTLLDDLGRFKLKLTQENGKIVEEGAGKNSLRNPAACLAELATQAIQRNQPLEAGELVSTGTLSKAPDIAAGQEWKVELEGLDLPTLRLKFT